ncbi:MAG: single-stranded DNA-binding protein [Verrucomicrobia bacterium]|nr:single-stranded DNA-binding protein [Verrucomicrobiota bacterium]
MVSLNRVILAGNLTRDPEVRYTPSGNAVADLNLAVNRVYTVNGEQKEEVCYVGVVVWGRQAETSGEYLSKGSPVLIEGILQYDQWETENGDKRSRLRVRADRVQFLGSPKKGEYGDAPQGKRSSKPPQEDVPPAPPKGDEGDDDDLPF